MKKILCLFAVALLGLSVQLQAQNTTELFRFVYQPTSDGPKKALVHNSTDHTAVFENLQSEQFSKQAGYLQAFILKKLENQDGKVLIASAKAPEYFLKFNSSTNTVQFAKINAGENLTPFTWEIILNSETDVNLIALQTVAKNRFAVKMENNAPKVANRITPGGAKVDQNFSFRLERVTNVF
ncbi:exported hypothetical protein [Tenacibaculum litopenaei]|uniref:hypothetical protein n=1 Tax=Tenacibaculum litopenaei TaxID=396016 RepID=UPI003892E41B